MRRMLMIGIAVIWLSVLGGLAISAQDKYTVKVPGGLAFSEFRGYEAWQSISISRNDRVIAVMTAGFLRTNRCWRTALIGPVSGSSFFLSA
jgi:hypothetical protein